MIIHKQRNCIAQESIMHKPAKYIAGEACLFQCQICRVQSTDRTPATCEHHRPPLVVAQVIFLRVCVSVSVSVCLFLVFPSAFRHPDVALL